MLWIPRMLIDLHFRISKIIFISPFLLRILNSTRVYIQMEINIRVCVRVCMIFFTIFTYLFCQVWVPLTLYLGFKAPKKRISSVLCVRPHMCLLVCDKQCYIKWYSDYFFVVVNMVDLFRLMLFSAKTIKVIQACISVDLLSLQSSLDWYWFELCCSL